MKNNNDAGDELVRPSEELGCPGGQRAGAQPAPQLRESYRGVEEAFRGWRASFDGIRDAIFIHDADFRIVRANRAYAELAGADIKAIVGKRYWQVFPSLDGPLEGCAHGAEAAAEVEDEIALPDGRILRSRAYGVPDERGVHRLAVHIFEDVTEALASQRALEARTAELEARVKEQQCLVAISNLAAEFLPIENFLQRVMGELAAAYRYPEIACVRVLFEGARLETHACADIEVARQSAEIFVGGQSAGMIEVCYLEPCPEADEGPFFKEERALLDAVASLVGGAIERQRATQGLAARTRHQAALAQLGRHALAGMPLPELLQAATKEIAAALDVELCKVLRLSADGETLRLEAGVGWKRGYVGAASVPVREGSQAGFTLCAGAPVVVDDLASETRFHGPQLLVEHGVVSGASVVIEGVGAPFGVLGAHTSKRRHFSGEDVEFLQAAADQLGMGIAKSLSQQSLERSEAQLSAIANSALDAILMIDSVGRLIFVNPAVERVFGYEADELLGRDLHETLAPSRYHADYRRAFPEFARAGQGVAIGKVLELQARRKDGTEFPMELSLSAFQLSGEWHAVGVLRDITARVQAEAALRESETRFRTIFDSALDGIVLAEADTGRLGSANAQFCRMLGYTEQEVTELRVVDIHPADELPRVQKAFEQQLRGELALAEELPVLRKNGSVFYADINSAPLMLGDKRYLLGMFRDVTERKAAQERVRQSQAGLAKAQQIAHLGNWDWDIVNDTLAWSDEIYRIFGLRPEEFGGTYAALLERVHPADRDAVTRAVETALANQAGYEVDHRIVLPDGGERYVRERAEVVCDGQGRVLRLIGTVQDVTEAKRAEHVIERSEARLKEAQQVARLGSWELDLVDNVLWWSDENYRIFGVEPGTGNTYETFLDTVHPDDRAFVDQAYTESVKKRTPYNIEHRLLLKDGSVKWVNERCRTHYDHEGRPLRSVGTTLDITERMEKEEKLKASYDLIKLIVENAPLRVFWKDKELRYLGCNTRFAEDAGFERPDELLGKTDFEMAWRDRAELYRRDDAAVMDSGVAKLNYEEPQTATEGQAVWLRTSKVPLRNSRKEVFGLLGIYDDITDEKQAQAAIQRANRALRTLSRGNEALVRADTEQDFLDKVCRAIVDDGGYRLAWVGLVENDADRSVRPAARAGFDEGYVDQVRASWADVERGRGPIGRCVRERRACIVRNVETNTYFAPWRDAALERGYRSLISLPLLAEGDALGALSIYSVDANVFDQDEVALLNELAADLAYGIGALRAKDEHERTSARYGQLLLDTIRVIALTLEKKDPYTAGHQQRVAQLAVAMAQEQGFDDHAIEGIRLGAIVHDIGKIYVPAELLSRPGKLSPVEYEMIKSHAEVGYEILRDVDFPWPVAEMIRQHHERLDGSGYPQGLTGDQIIPEAKILAVADTVEAIASHRPYRPSRGTAKALEVIEAGRGTLFDPAAVDACLALFGTGRFAWDDDAASGHPDD